MNVVSNSSPLIFLSKIGRLDVLIKLYDKVYIPLAVYDETVVSGKNDDVAKYITKGILEGYIIKFQVKNELAVNALSGRLHSGEVEVMVGAYEIGIKDVILDDLYARNKAKQLGLYVTGTLGILHVAYKRGFIKDFETDINKLISVDFRISTTLVQRILKDIKDN